MHGWIVQASRYMRANTELLEENGPANMRRFAHHSTTPVRPLRLPGLGFRWVCNVKGFPYPGHREREREMYRLSRNHITGPLIPHRSPSIPRPRVWTYRPLALNFFPQWQEYPERGRKRVKVLVWDEADDGFRSCLAPILGFVRGVGGEKV
jgi:hypothetical protein